MSAKTLPVHPPAAVRAAGWMLVTMCSFLGMAVAVRQLDQSMSVFQILFLRSLIGLVVIAAIALPRSPGSLRTREPFLQLARNTVHFAGQGAWMWGVTVLPLAEVFALEFTTPIWVALMATFILGERLGPMRVLAVAGGFVGVLLIARPGAAVFDPRALVVLGAAVCFAGSVVMVKQLTRTDSALAILFWMSVVQLPMALVPAVDAWVTPALADVPWILVVGLAGLAAHLGMARALSIADATVIFPMDFLRLPAVALLGFVLYAEPLDPWTLAGAVIIFTTNYAAVRHEARRIPRALT